MFRSLSERARNVIQAAAAEARQMNHSYVGTEHILLALVADGSTSLARLGVDTESVRHEVGKLVQRGSTPVAADDIPLTPRAKQAVEFAISESASVNLAETGVEHLFIGLIRQADGVAGQALRNLGLDLQQIRREVLKLRLMQMTIVERAVRPVRAGVARKRKMREELLTHLTTIYHQELARLNDPTAALQEAARRFGDPAQLSRELEIALPASERITHRLERWFGWRAPESVLRMMTRTSIVTFFIVAIATGLPIFAGILFEGWNMSQVIALRALGAMLLLLPMVQFAFGMLYYKMRDALWGAFGSRKSILAISLCGILMAMIVFASSVGFIGIVNATVSPLFELIVPLCVISLLAPFVCLLLARTRGRVEICDTVWATLDLNAAS